MDAVLGLRFICLGDELSCRFAVAMPICAQCCEAHTPRGHCPAANTRMTSGESQTEADEEGRGREGERVV